MITDILAKQLNTLGKEFDYDKLVYRTNPLLAQQVSQKLGIDRSEKQLTLRIHTEAFEPEGKNLLAYFENLGFTVSKLPNRDAHYVDIQFDKTKPGYEEAVAKFGQQILDKAAVLKAVEEAKATVIRKAAEADGAKKKLEQPADIADGKGLEAEAAIGAELAQTPGNA
jgi:hypothetical protein